MLVFSIVCIFLCIYREGVLSDTFSPSKRLKLNHDDEEKQKLVIDIEKSSQHTDQLVCIEQFALHVFLFLFYLISFNNSSIYL